jgi:pyruvate/2-oxoglutarate dehydrogenase complex dihydrolipoamide dehydrogenase (E3) component
MRSVEVDFRFADLMARVQRVIAKVEPHDSVERYTALGVDCVAGNARLTTPWTVVVDGAGRQAGADGPVHHHRRRCARPFVPPIPGLEDDGTT